MKTKGIRISDGINNVVSVQLIDILEEVQKEQTFSWSILFLDAIGLIGGSQGIPDFEEIRISEKGLFLKALLRK